MPPRPGWRNREEGVFWVQGPWEPEAQGPGQRALAPWGKAPTSRELPA